MIALHAASRVMLERILQEAGELRDGGLGTHAIELAWGLMTGRAADGAEEPFATGTAGAQVVCVAAVRARFQWSA